MSEIVLTAITDRHRAAALNVTNAIDGKGASLTQVATALKDIPQLVDQVRKAQRAMTDVIVEVAAAELSDDARQAIGRALNALQAVL